MTASRHLSEDDERCIRGAIDELAQRGGRPLDYDELYCVYKTQDKPDFEAQREIREFVESVMDEKQFDDDVKPVIRVSAPSVAVSESISVNNESNEPTVPFAVFISYTF